MESNRPGDVRTPRPAGGYPDSGDAIDRQRAATGANRAPAGLARHMAQPRTVTPVSPQHQISSGSDSSGSDGDDDGVTPRALSSRQASQLQPLATIQPPPGPLPQTGNLPIGDGGKIIFTRTNGGDLPTAKDELLGEVNKLEESGELDSEKAGKLKTLLSGLNTALDFLMHNKKFQVGVGLVGLGVCVCGSVFCPLVLVPSGVFILIFANGFIDNPMLTGPEGPTSSSPAPETKKKSENEDDDKNKKGANPAGKKPPGSGDDDNGGPPGPGSVNIRSNTHDDKRRVEDEERKKAEDEAKAIQARLKTQGVHTHAGVVHQDDLTSELERLQGVAVKQAIDAFDIDDFLQSEEGFGPETSQLRSELEDAGVDVADMERIIKSRIRFLAAEYQLDEVQSYWEDSKAVKDSFYTPKPDEWKSVRNALTREAAKQLVSFVRSNHGLPDSGESRERCKMTSDHLLARAAQNIGLPLIPGSGTLLTQIVPWQCAPALNNWHNEKVKAGKNVPPLPLQKGH